MVPGATPFYRTPDQSNTGEVRTQTWGGKGLMSEAEKNTPSFLPHLLPDRPTPPFWCRECGPPCRALPPTGEQKRKIDRLYLTPPVTAHTFWSALWWWASVPITKHRRLTALVRRNRNSMQVFEGKRCLVQEVSRGRMFYNG